MSSSENEELIFRPPCHRDNLFTLDYALHSTHTRITKLFSTVPTCGQATLLDKFGVIPIFDQ